MVDAAETLMAVAALVKLTRWAIVAVILCCAAAAFVYPGGTALDPAQAGYSWSQNFISDLGMTVSHSGRDNAFGAALFMAGFGLLAFSLAAGATSFVRLHSSSTRARGLALAAGAGALLVAGALAGTAIYSADRAPHVHLWLAQFASVIATITALLFAVAAGRDGRLPVTVTIVWLVVAAAIGAWSTVRWWGPDSQTSAGFAFYATLQKLVALIIVGGLLHQQHHAGRAAARPPKAVRSSPAS